MSNHTNPEVVIIGAGAAGSSAALVLGRARTVTLVIDEGDPSNAPASGIGGLLGNDGTSPSEFYRRAADELAAYPTIMRRSGVVTSVSPSSAAGWSLHHGSGEVVTTERILVATGMRYSPPEIDGLADRWGASIFHCPFCHGWEHRDAPLAVLGGPAGTLERALLLRRWTSDLTLITADAVLSPDDRHTLDLAGIDVVEGEIAAVDGPGRTLDTVTLTDGSSIRVSGLLVPAPHRFRRPELIDQLGVATTPDGHIAADSFGATSVRGVWAVGDVVTAFSNVAGAVAGGSAAAAAITRDLVMSRYGPAA